MMRSCRTFLTNSAPALALAALLWCMIDCRLPLAAWLIPAMLLIGGEHETD